MRIALVIAVILVVLFALRQTQVTLTATTVVLPIPTSSIFAIDDDVCTEWSVLSQPGCDRWEPIQLRTDWIEAPQDAETIVDVVQLVNNVSNETGIDLPTLEEAKAMLDRWRINGGVAVPESQVVHLDRLLTSAESRPRPTTIPDPAWAQFQRSIADFLSWLSRV